MTDWPAVFLAAIAVATGTMALIQIGVIIYGARLAWRVTKLADRVERQLDPVMDKVTQMSADASRATKLAVAQVERADETLDLAQQVLVVPAQRGLALIDSLRAIFSPPSEPSAQGADTDTASEASSDKDEALFVG